MYLWAKIGTQFQDRIRTGGSMKCPNCKHSTTERVYISSLDILNAVRLRDISPLGCTAFGRSESDRNLWPIAMNVWQGKCKGEKFEQKQNT